MAPSVPRCSAAQSVRAIGPTTWSFGAPRAPSQTHTLAVVGRLNEATGWPEEFVKVITVPLVRPKYFTFGWSVNGCTVSVLVVYAFQALAMYGSRYVALNSPASAALPGASPRRTVPSARVTTVLPQPAWALTWSMTFWRPLALSAPVVCVAPSAPVTVTACGTANMSTWELLSHRPASL